MNWLWLLTIVGAVSGGLFTINGLMTATGAPQQAAAGAVGAAFAVIPYCLARAVSEMKRENSSKAGGPVTPKKAGEGTPVTSAPKPVRPRCASCGYTLQLKDLKPSQGNVITCQHCGAENALSDK